MPAELYVKFEEKRGSRRKDREGLRQGNEEMMTSARAMQRYDAEIYDSVFSRQDMGRYPSEDLVCYIMRLYKNVPERCAIRILDLGCGEGSNTRFLRKEGFDAIGTDGSIVALKKHRGICDAEGLACRLIKADFSKLPFRKGSFDCVVDVSSIQHNVFSDLESISGQIYDLLKKNGRFFSFCFREGSYGYADGMEIEPNTFVGLESGCFKSKGCVHFFSKEELLELYKGFAALSVDEVSRTFQNGKFCWKYWIVTAQK